MAKLRKNRKGSKWCRFVDWVNGDTEEIAVDPEKVIEPCVNESKSEEAVEKTGVESFFGNLIKLDGESSLNQQLDQFQKHGMELFNRVYKVMSVMICAVIIGVLLFTVSYLPKFGNAENPVNNQVSERYIEKGMEETGAVNLVTGMILDYRAFDTFGESNVLFVAACTVLILLRIDIKGKSDKKKGEQSMDESEENDRIYEPKNDVILQRVATCLVPPIMIFGVYVILNGHLSPGGGFSGGAIIGAGLILYLNAFGFKKTERFFTMKTFKAVTFGALLFYALSKSYSFFMGANHFESGIPIGTPGDIISSGLILPLNICVGLVVACTMYGFYAIFRKGGM